MKRSGCPPHAYRAVGETYKPIIGEKRKARTPTKYNRARFDVATVYGPVRQRIFCAKCGEESSVLAGAAGRR